MTARPRAKLLVRRGRRSISGSAMRPWRRTKAAGAGQGDEQGDDGDGHGAGEDRRDAVEDADEGQRDERGGGRVQPRTGDLGLVADADEGGDPGRRDEHGEEGEEQVPVAEPEDRAGDDRAGGRAEGRHRRDDAHRGAEPLGRRDRQCEVHADRHDHAGAEGLHDAVPRACTMRCRGPARCGDEHDDEVRGERAEDRAGQQSRPRAHRRSRCVRTERWRRPVTGTMIAAAGMQAVVTQPMAPEPTPGSCIIGVRTTLRRVSLKVARKVVAGGHDGGHRSGAAARA